MRIHVMTLFPDIFAAYIGESMIKKAIDNGILEINLFKIEIFRKISIRRLTTIHLGEGQAW